MGISILLLQQMLQLFFMMMMGYAVVKCGILKATDSKVLSTIAVYAVTPCVIINAFQIDFTEQTMMGLLLSFGAAIGAQLLFVPFTSLLGKGWKLNEVERASILYCNAGNMIIPIVTAILGGEWVIYTTGYIAVQIVSLWTFGKQLLCGEKNLDWKKILKNINIICIVIGMALFLCGIHLPGLVKNTLSSVGGMMGPLGMFVLGMLMAKNPLKSIFLNKKIYRVAAVRLLVCPLMILAIFKLTGLANILPDAANILFITFLATCAPPAVNITQMAQIYGKDAEYSSAINIVSISLCFVSIPLMAMLYWALIG